jgi:hypothetical protein
LVNSLKFFGPQMAPAYRLNAILQSPKNSRFQGPNPLPLALLVDAAHTVKNGEVENYATLAWSR